MLWREVGVEMVSKRFGFVVVSDDHKPGCRDKRPVLPLAMNLNNLNCF